MLSLLDPKAAIEDLQLLFHQAVMILLRFRIRYPVDLKLGILAQGFA